MKSLILFLLAFFYYLGGKQKAITEFRIGKFLYLIETTKKYLHDDDFNATFFVVLKKEGNKKQCTSFKLATRNDSVFIKGKFVISKIDLRFKQYYYYNRNLTSADSVETVFCPNKKGDLILKSVIEFKKGVGKITHY
jgi:hypothetical protein